MTETNSPGSEVQSHPQRMFEPEPGSCQVLLVRHGQSAAYVEGVPFELVGGHGDPPLSTRGLWQADRVRARLATEPIDAIYTSSLTRTHQTAAPLAKALKLTPTINVDLREVFLGEFEGGLFRKMAAEGHPAIAAFRKNQEWGEIPGAESNAVFQGRVVNAIDSIAKDHPDQLVAVFCHGGVIGAALSYAIGGNDFSFLGVRNASLSFLSIEPALARHDGWTVRSYNDAGHCGPLTRDAEPDEPGLPYLS